MKTNVNVSTTKMQDGNYNSLATIKKVSVNPELHPAKVISKKPAGKLSIKGYELREWLEHLNGSNGLYFLDLSQDSYSMHFKHHVSGKVMELDCQEDFKTAEDPQKEILESLLFDLSLFPEEPILTFNSDTVEKQLRNLAAIYYERAAEIDCIIGRLVNIDIRKLFESGIYNDSKVKEISVDGIYHALYAGTSRSFSKENGSYGIYLIFLAIQSVFYQIIGRNAMA